MMVKEHVQTNMGLIPLEDYLDIRANQMGFEDYEDLRNNGYSIDKPDVILLDEFGEEVEKELE